MFQSFFNQIYILQNFRFNFFSCQIKTRKMSYFISEIKKYILYIISSSGLLTIVGIIGNSIVLYIITRKGFIKETMFRYYIVVQVVDILGLIMIWFWYVPIFFGFGVSDLFCKIVEYILYIMYSFYSWVNLLTSTDRLLSVMYPHDFLIRKAFKFQALAVATLFIFSIMINVPNFLFHSKSNFTFCGIPAWDPYPYHTRTQQYPTVPKIR